MNYGIKAYGKCHMFKTKAAFRRYLMNWIASKSTAANSGKYMGAFATACNLGQFASSPLLGITLALFGTQQSVFAVGAVIGVAAAIGSLVFAGRIEADELAEAGRA